jgi:hypothetical protein
VLGKAKKRAEEEVATEETPTYPFISVDSATKKWYW